jgi:hypothetical protein
MGMAVLLFSHELPRHPIQLLGYANLFGLDRAWLELQTNFCVEIQAMCIRKQLFYAHFRDFSVKQVAHVGLIVIKNLDQPGLGISLAPNAFQQGGQDLRFDLQCQCFRYGEPEIVKDIGLSDVTWSISFSGHLLSLSSVAGVAGAPASAVLSQSPGRACRSFDYAFQNNAARKSHYRSLQDI